MTSRSQTCIRLNDNYLSMSVCRSAPWREKLRQVNVFQFQKVNFPIHAAAVSREVSVRADYPMAGDDKGDGVVPDRPADRLCGHPREAPCTSDPCGNFTVSPGLPEGDGQHDFPYDLAERTGPQIQRWREIGSLSAEIDVQPSDRIVEDGPGPLLGAVGKRVGEMFLTIKPEADQRLTIAGQSNAAQRRFIVA